MLTSPDSPGGYIVDGARLWTKTFGSTLADSTQALAGDPNGGVHLLANVRAGTDFGGGALLAAAPVAIASFGSDGSYRWLAKSDTGGNLGVGGGLTIDSAGRVILAGNFRDTLVFGTDTLTTGPNSTQDVFVARFSPGGAYQWARGFPGAGDGLPYNHLFPVARRCPSDS